MKRSSELVSGKVNLAFIVISFILFASVLTFGQEVTWRTFGTSDKKITVSFPSDPLIVNVDEWVKLYSNVGDVSFSFIKQPMSGSHKYIKNLEFEAVKKENIKQFEEGGLSAKQVIFDLDNQYKIQIYIGSRDVLFTISASAKSKDDPILKRFLGSVLINKNTAFSVEKIANPGGASPEILEDLRSSKIVNEMLDKDCGDELNYGFGVEPPTDIPTQSAYTRPLIILRRQKAVFHGVAHQDFVRLRVLFKADGCIGQVLVVGGGRSPETQSALLAVKFLKFIPAEVMGKSVDSIKSVEYAFR